MKPSTSKKYLVVLSSLLFLAFFNEGLSQEAAEDNKTLKILSFNILHGATTRGDFNLDVIAKVIKDCDPDFVALQEVDFKTKRAKKYDLATELGWRTGLAPVFARAMYYDGGEYGEAILSRYSFISTRNIPLPYTPGNEPRAAVEIVTVLPSGDTIAFIGTHLDHLKNDNDRTEQVKKINEVFRLNPFPAILAGDMNATPGSRPINILEKIWDQTYDKENPAPTFPSDKPAVKIDYVMLYPKGRWKTIETRVIQDSIASDHCALLVTVELSK